MKFVFIKILLFCFSVSKHKAIFVFRLLFKLPRVVQDQREKFESEDLFKKHVREGEVRYTLHRDRPVHERQAKFQAGCRDGHTEIVSKENSCIISNSYKKLLNSFTWTC